MNRWQEFLYIIRRLNRQSADRDLDEEIRAHLDHEIQNNIEKGFSPDEARLKALRSFGSIALSKERSRSMWGAHPIETFIQDLRYGLRVLTKKPAFIVVALISLALGIGANTVIFSGVYAMLLQPLPFKAADRLMLVSQLNKQGLDSGTAFLDYTDWKQQNTVFQQMAVFRTINMNLTRRDSIESISGNFVSQDFFDLLGSHAVLGRTLLKDDFSPASEKTIVLSFSLWQDRFGSDANIIGRQIKLNDSFFTVVGVIPANQQFPFRTEFCLPLETNENTLTMQDRSANYYAIIAALKPGISQSKAAQELSQLEKRSAQQKVEYEEQTIVLTSLRDTIPGISKYRQPLAVLQIAVLFVLLIANANLANLIMARTTGRRQEFAIRLALGAGRSRLIRQLLSESLLLGALGTALGLVLAGLGVTWLRSAMPLTVFGATEIKINAPVLLFTLVVSLITSLGFGLYPAVLASGQDLNEALKSAASGLTAASRKRRFSSLIVPAEIALATVLLIGSGLLARTFLNLTKEDPGFNPDNAIAVTLSIPSAQNANYEKLSLYFNEATTRLTALPGIEHVGAVTYMPLVGYNPGTDFSINGKPVASSEIALRADFQPVSYDYFNAIGMPLIRGQQFTPSDMKPPPTAVIINSTMAKKFWPDEDPLGKQIRLPEKNGFVSPLTIVGVVGDVRQYGLQDDPRPEMYIPTYRNSMTMIVRAKAGAGDVLSSVKQTILKLDAENGNDTVAAFNIRTLDQMLRTSIEKRKFFAMLLGVMSVSALLLSAMGIYGVISYIVAQRTREIGIRIALGAERKHVLKMIILEGMTLVMLGIVPGLASSLALTRSLKSLLFGVSAIDLTTYLGIVIVLCATALLACYAPARRASKVNPMTALRYE